MPKILSLGVRVQLKTKAALEKAARDDLRSVSSLIEKVLVEWLREKGYLPTLQLDANRVYRAASDAKVLAIRGASAHQHGNAVFELLACQQKTILGRPLHRIAERADAARNDRDLVDRIDARQGRGDQCMPHLVMGDAVAFRRAKDTALFSSPATMRSIAAVKSSSVTASPLRRVATMAASLTRLARSAPVKPVVNPAIWSRSTPSAMRTLAT